MMTGLDREQLAEAIARRLETPLRTMIEEIVAEQFDRCLKELLMGALGHVGTKRSKI